MTMLSSSSSALISSSFSRICSSPCVFTPHLRLYILPVLGEVKLSNLKTPMIQKVYNRLIKEKGLSPKTVKNAHGCLHKALSVAVKIGYIAKNPSEACVLPKVNQAEIQPLDTPEITKLLETVKGQDILVDEFGTGAFSMVTVPTVPLPEIGMVKKVMPPPLSLSCTTA